MSANNRPNVRTKYDNRQLSPSQILLVLKILIRGDQNGESAILRSPKQFPILQLHWPPGLHERPNLVAAQEAPDADGNVLVK